MYMSALIRQLRSQNLFTDPGKLNHIATTAMSAFEVSSEIGTPKKLYDLGMQLKTIPPKRITMLTMPRIEDPQDPQAHYLPEPGAADTVWSLLRNDVAMDSHGKAKTTTSASAKPTTSAPTGPPARRRGHHRGHGRQRHGGYGERCADPRPRGVPRARRSSPPGSPGPRRRRTRSPARAPR